MILKLECSCLDKAWKHHTILHKDVIVQHSDRSGLCHLAIADLGTLNRNIITLPKSWTARDIDSGRLTLVEGSCLTVIIGLVVVGIEHL